MAEITYDRPLRPDGTRDRSGDPYTTEWWERTIAARLAEHESLCVCDQRHIEQIQDFRARQAAGNAAPAWDRYSEIEVLIPDSDDRAFITYQPKPFTGTFGHMSINGPVSETGYRSHFLLGDDIPGIPITQYALELVLELRATVLVEMKKRRRAAKRKPKHVVVEAAESWPVLPHRTPTDQLSLFA